MICHPPNPITRPLWPYLLLLYPCSPCFSHPVLFLLLVYSWSAPTWVFSGILFPQGSCMAHCSPPARPHLTVTLLFKIPPPYRHFSQFRLFFYFIFIHGTYHHLIYFIYSIHCKLHKYKHFGLVFLSTAVSPVPRTVPGAEQIINKYWMNE